MTQEEKQLLLKDLCARLPYGVVCKISYTFNNETTNWEDVESTCDDIITRINFDTKEVFSDWLSEYSSIDDVKPYLRLMSSMAEEEKEELCRLCDFEKSYDDRDYFTHYGIEVISEYCVDGKKIPESVINYSVIDFFYEHHLDWRGLIPMGLALEALEGMYKTE